MPPAHFHLLRFHVRFFFNKLKWSLTLGKGESGCILSLAEITWLQAAAYPGIRCLRVRVLWLVVEGVRLPKENAPEGRGV